MDIVKVKMEKLTANVLLLHNYKRPSEHSVRTLCHQNITENQSNPRQKILTNFRQNRLLQIQVFPVHCDSVEFTNSVVCAEASSWQHQLRVAQTPYLVHNYTVSSLHPRGIDAGYSVPIWVWPRGFLP